MMPDFTFYTDSYLGCRIPEKQFAASMARASEALACFRRIYTVSGGAEEQKLALCAMAEAVYDAQRRGGVVSASAGSVAVRYRDAEEAQLWRELYERARIYLDIYRGVG